MLEVAFTSQYDSVQLHIVPVLKDAIACTHIVEATTVILH